MVEGDAARRLARARTTARFDGVARRRRTAPGANGLIARGRSRRRRACAQAVCARLEAALRPRAPMVGVIGAATRAGRRSTTRRRRARPRASRRCARARRRRSGARGGLTGSRICGLPGWSAAFRPASSRNLSVASTGSMGSRASASAASSGGGVVHDIDSSALSASLAFFKFQSLSARIARGADSARRVARPDLDLSARGPAKAPKSCARPLDNPA